MINVSNEFKTLMSERQESMQKLHLQMAQF